MLVLLGSEYGAGHLLNKMLIGFLWYSYREVCCGLSAVQVLLSGQCDFPVEQSRMVIWL